MRFVLAINILHEEMMAVLRAESCELRAPSFEQTNEPVASLLENPRGAQVFIGFMEFPG